MFTLTKLLATGLLLAGISQAVPEAKPPTKPTKPTHKPHLPLTTTKSVIPSPTPGGHAPVTGPLPPGGEYRIGVVVFPGFTALDVFGPLEAFTTVQFIYYLNLSIIAETLDPVSTFPNRAWWKPKVNTTYSDSILPTHTFETANFPLDLLIIPGGSGVRAPSPYLNTTVDFIKKAAPKCKYVLSVCTGALITARSGILDGKRATTNKLAWNTVIPNGPLVKWVAVARWVIDGNIWSSSGVSAGTDAALAWIAHVYGDTMAKTAANNMEWTGDYKNSEHDEFAALNNLSSANNTNGA